MAELSSEAQALYQNAIPVATSFGALGAYPIDLLTNLKTIADRDAIPVERRYPYMKTTVQEDGETYVLVGGLGNECWVRENAHSTAMGAYKWCVDSEASPVLDEVHVLKDGVWTNTGKTIKAFENDNYNGTWFYISNTADDNVIPAGRTRYKMISDGYTDTGVDIDGANGYLSCREYIIWVGRWIKVPIYEAKASTVKNSDGQYSPKFGVDGIMSSTDKAYLTDLIERFIASCMAAGLNSGNDCIESGLYGNVTLGRPAGSQTGEYYNVAAIKDKSTGYTSQIAVHEDAEGIHPNMFFRGKLSNVWTRLLNTKDLVSNLGISHQTGAYPNWLTDIGIYNIISWAQNAANLPPTAAMEDSSGRWKFFTLPGAPDATTPYARTQYAMDTENMAVHVRWHSNYVGSGSLADATAWSTLISPIFGAKSVTEEKLAPSSVTEEKLSPELLQYMDSLKIAPNSYSLEWDSPSPAAIYSNCNASGTDAGDCLIVPNCTFYIKERFCAKNGSVYIHTHSGHDFFKTYLGFYDLGTISSPEWAYQYSGGYKVYRYISGSSKYVNCLDAESFTCADTVDPAAMSYGLIYSVPESLMTGGALYEFCTDYLSLSGIINEVTELEEKIDNIQSVNDAMIFKGILGTTSDSQSEINKIFDDNAWQAGWAWSFDKDINFDDLAGLSCVGSSGTVKYGDMLIAIKNHPETPILASSSDGYFTIMRTNSDAAEAKEYAETASRSAESAALTANAAKQEAEDALMAAAWAQEYADGLYNESWKDEPVLTIEITEECAAIDVTEIDGQPFSFERLGGYAELVTNASAEGRLCILLNKTGSGASYNGLVCMNTNGSSTEGALQKGVFEVKHEFGIWHTTDIASTYSTWLSMSSTKHEHWDSRGYFADVENITSFRLIPYSGVFNAGTVIKIYGKPPKEVTA